MQLTSNLGTLDRLFRLVIGGLLVVLTLMGTIGVWGWLGLVLVATATVTFCPIYRAFGMCTKKDCVK